MSIVELYTSREMHITKEGTNLTRKFTCTATDFNAGTDGAIYLPVVGNAFSEVRADLIVSDVMVYWLDNVNCRYEAMYSTRGAPYRDEIVDSSQSVRHSFDFSTTMQSAKNFVDSDGNEQTWQTLWVADGKSGDAPGLMVYQPGLVWIVKAPVSSWDFIKIKDHIRSVNDRDFLKQWLFLWDKDYVDVTGDDTGKWFFAGFSSNQIATAKYEVTMMFLYEDEGWNTPHQMSTSIKLYKETDFNSLPFPQQAGAAINDGLR